MNHAYSQFGGGVFAERYTAVLILCHGYKYIYLSFIPKTDEFIISLFDFVFSISSSAQLTVSLSD